jgi:hypothetical protein
MVIKNCLSCVHSRKAKIKDYVGCLLFTAIKYKIDYYSVLLSQDLPSEIIKSGISKSSYGLVNLYAKPNVNVKSEDPYIRNNLIVKEGIIVEKNQKCYYYKGIE